MYGIWRPSLSRIKLVLVATAYQYLSQKKLVGAKYGCFRMNSK